jgi:hypothetical protein
MPPAASFMALDPAITSLDFSMIFPEGSPTRWTRWEDVPSRGVGNVMGMRVLLFSHFPRGDTVAPHHDVQ